MKNADKSIHKEDNSREGFSPPLSWTNWIPLYLTIASAITLILIGFFLVENIQWYKNEVFAIYEARFGTYRMRAFDVHLSMIKRSIGLFSGFSMLFLGLGVSFYSIKRGTELGVQSELWSANLVTASPGIVSMIVGAWLISFTIQSKDTFLPYEPDFRIEFSNKNEEWVNQSFPSIKHMDSISKSEIDTIRNVKN